MIELEAPVGRNAVNRAADVRAVQALLNEQLDRIAPLARLLVDGVCGPKTIAAIEAFQRRGMNAASPDGLILPDGPTLRALNAARRAPPVESGSAAPDASARAAGDDHAPPAPGGPAPIDPSGEPPWLSIASAEEGTREAPGLGDNNPRILEYLSIAPRLAGIDYLRGGAATGRKMSEVDETPWCACFVGWCMKQAGLPSGPGARAKDWRGYGNPLDAPQLGAITVIYRPPFNDSASGWHVAFWVGGTPEQPILLGGNQNNRVTRKRYGGLSQIHFRWPV